MSFTIPPEVSNYVNSIEWLHSERYILAHILHHPESIYDISLKLRPEYFNNSINQVVFTTMLSVQAEAKIDVTTLLQAIRGVNITPEYLDILLHTETNQENLRYHIHLIRQAYARRLLFEHAQQMMIDAVNATTDDDLDAILGRQQQRFIDIQLHIDDTDKVTNFAEKIGEFLSKKQANPTKVLGVSTGFARFDERVGGLIPGRLYVIGGRSKTGKTALLLNWAKNAAIDQHLPVLYINTEMRDEDMMDRLVSCISGVPEHVVSAGLYIEDKEQLEKVIDAKEQIENSIFLHDYMPVATMDQVFSLAYKYKMKHDIKLMVFDYIKDTTPGQHGRLRDDVVLGQITMSLKNIAGQLNIPILTAAQLNRGAIMAEETNEAHIYGSDQIVFFADYVFYLRRIPEPELQKIGVSPAIGDITLVSGPTRYRGEYGSWIRFDRDVQRMQETEEYSVNG